MDLLSFDDNVINEKVRKQYRGIFVSINNSILGTFFN